MEVPTPKKQVGGHTKQIVPNQITGALPSPHDSATMPWTNQSCLASSALRETPEICYPNTASRTYPIRACASYLRQQDVIRNLWSPWYYVLWCYIISYQIKSYSIILNNILSYYIILYHDIYHIILNHISYSIILYVIVPYYMISYDIVLILYHIALIFYHMIVYCLALYGSF